MADPAVQGVAQVDWIGCAVWNRLFGIGECWGCVWVVGSMGGHDPGGVHAWAGALGGVMGPLCKHVTAEAVSVLR